MKQLILILGVLFILPIACMQKQEASASQEKTSEETTTVADETSKETTYLNLDLEGYRTPNINLQDYKGEVIFINYWGSWCPPCRREMPSIQSLYEKYKDKVKFVLIAQEKQPGKHKLFIDNHPEYTFPVYVPTSPIATEIKPNRGFPTTIIINKKGEIVSNDVGAANWDASVVHQSLDGLLAE